MAQNRNICTSHRQFLAQISSLFTELINFSVLLLFFFFLHALFILQRTDLRHHRLAASCFLLLFIIKHCVSGPSPVYLLDFSCLKPPDCCKVPFSTYIAHARTFEFLDEESVSFIQKTLTHSGQGDETYLPTAVHCIPPKSSQQEAIKEVHGSLFVVLDDLLSKTKISPLEIDILVVNCSGFCPAPSLSSIIVNKYSMKEDIKSFTISGMGCSASALAIDLVQNILKTHKNSHALVLSTEILSTGWYSGREKSMMILNCVFRMGAAAVLLSNKKEAKRKAKYKLLHSVRTQNAFDDKAYNSAMRKEDADGLTGVAFTRDLLQSVRETLRSHIIILGPKILPCTEMILYAISIIKRKYLTRSTATHVPNFTTLVQHFCLPVSGKAVIAEIGKGLRLGEREMEPAMATLHRFGNQSSSSLWYELSYLEGKERVKKGDRVWQLGLGTGIKCTSLVWECIRPIIGEAHLGNWADSIDQYPLRAHEDGKGIS